MAQVEATPHGLRNPSRVQLLRLSLVPPRHLLWLTHGHVSITSLLGLEIWFPLQERTSAPDTVATIQSSARLWDTWANPGPLS